MFVTCYYFVQVYLRHLNIILRFYPENIFLSWKYCLIQHSITVNTDAIYPTPSTSGSFPLTSETLYKDK